uniref:Uncharacterized protein n=1 Tax=Anguilla anguilla TaxID=7936 RepID=A0A0E9PYU5_ANGAN
MAFLLNKLYTFHRLHYLKNIIIILKGYLKNHIFQLM